MRERLWRKLVSLTLAFALVISMMPAIPGAVHVAHGATTISDISVTDITVPMVGDTPDYTASVPDGTAYYIGTDIAGMNVDVNGILWVNNTTTPIKQDATFAAGGSYDVRMEIYAKDGSSFAAKENLNVTINGQAAHVISRTDNMIYIRYTFGEPKEKESINSVALTMEGHELNGLIRGLTFDSADPIIVGSEYGTDKNYVVYLKSTTDHLTSETGEFYGWQQYYVGYYLEAKAGYVFHSLTPNQVTLNGQSACSLTNQNDGRILAIFALEMLGYIHEIELEVPLPAAGQQITKPTVISVDGDPSLNHLVSTEGSQWSASSFFIDGAEYEKVGSGNFQNGVAYKLDLEACPADTNTYYLADDCKVTVKTSDGQILQRGQTWAQDGWHYVQTNYFNLNAPTAYDTLKNWDMEINGYNGGESLLGLSAKVTANGKTLMLSAGETLMIYEESFAEPEFPYSIKYDTQYILTMPLLTADMNWPGVDWVIDDIDNVEITLHGQPLSVSDLMNMDGDWWVMYKLPILKEGVDCNGLAHEYKDALTKATFTADGKTYKKCSCGQEIDVTTIAKISTVQLAQTEYTFDGQSKNPTVVVQDANGKNLTEGTDYSLIRPENPKAAGSYTVTVVLQGNYEGTKNLTYKINAAPTPDPEPTPEPECSHQWKAATCTAAKTCKLCGETSGSKLGHSYSKSFTVDKQATTSVDGSKSKHCTRAGCNAKTSVTTIYKASKVKLSYTAATYSGSAKSPKVTVQNSKGQDIDAANYTLTTPSGRKNAGTYTYTVNFKDEYSGSKTMKLTINRKSLSSASLSKTAYVYTGKAIKPAVTVKNSSKVKLTKGTHYTVTYKNNTKVGKATVTITGKGNYKGTIKKTFKINPVATKITGVTAAKKAFTVKWTKKTKEITGYQICYGTSTNKDKCKKVLVTKNSTVSKKVTKLTKGKKYNVWVRTYKTVNGTKYYSAWSAKKTVKVK